MITFTIETVTKGKRKYYVLCKNNEKQCIGQFGFTNNQFYKFIRALEFIENTDNIQGFYKDLIELGKERLKE